MTRLRVDFFRKKRKTKPKIVVENWAKDVELKIKEWLMHPFIPDEQSDIMLLHHQISKTDRNETVYRRDGTAREKNSIIFGFFVQKITQIMLSHSRSFRSQNAFLSVSLRRATSTCIDSYKYLYVRPFEAVAPFYITNQ